MGAECYTEILESIKLHGQISEDNRFSNFIIVYFVHFVSMFSFTAPTNAHTVYMTVYLLLLQHVSE